jgi:hypothetical protein
MLVGNQWSQHCNRLRGRTENSIKNYYNATLRSKQASKRRGFLWAYIDRVRAAPDDDGLRYRAFADTVRAVHGQSNDWLPPWLRAMLDGGDLEVPRAGEALGRGWRRLLDGELAFLKDREADVTATGIPFPNPASSGLGARSISGTTAQPQTLGARGGRTKAPAGPAGGAARGTPPAHPHVRAQQQHHQHHQQLLYQAPPAVQMPLPMGAMAQHATAGDLDLICSSDLDAIMMAEGPLCPGDGTGLAGSGSCYGGSGNGGGSSGHAGGQDDEDDQDDLLLGGLPNALAPADGQAAGLVVAPGLPRLVVTAPQQAWWGTGGASLAAAVAAAAVGLGNDATPALSRDSSFCGSVVSTGATPTFSRLRLASNSPVPQPGGAFAAALDAEDALAHAAAAGGCGAAAGTPFAPGGPLVRVFQPSLLSTAASYGSEHSAGTGLHLAANRSGSVPGGYVGPTISTEMPGGVMMYQTHPHSGQDLQVNTDCHQQPGTPGTPDEHQCSSPFGSPHVQSGGAFDGGWGGGGGGSPVRQFAPGSAPAALGISGAGQPTLSRFAAARHSGGSHGQYAQPPPHAPAPLPFDVFSSGAAPLMAAVGAAAGLQQQHGAAAMRGSCCDTTDAFAPSNGAGGGGGGVMGMQLSEGLGLFSSGSLGMLLDGAPIFPDEPAACGGGMAGRRASSLGAGQGQDGLAAAIHGLVAGDSLHEGALDRMLNSDLP